MVPIELDDEVPPPTPPRPTRRRRRARRRLAVGAVVVVLALAAGQWTSDVRERAAWNRLSDRTDVIAPLGRSVRVLWTLNPSAFATANQGVSWRGTVVGPVLGADGSVGITQLDDRDGHRRWTTRVLGPDAGRVAQGETLDPDASCRRVPGDASRIVCLVLGDAVAKDGRPAAPVGAAGTHLVVVDPRDGQLRADHTVASDVSTLGPVLPGGLAVMTASSAGAGAVQVVGVDAASGAERWRRATSRAPEDPGRIRLLPVGDMVAVLGGSRLEVLGPDGTVHRSVTLAGNAGALPLADGRLVVADLDGTLVVDPDRDVRLDGAPMRPAFDDGSVPGLTLVRSGTLHAYDSDGHQRWQLPGSSPTGVVVVRGVVYLTRDGDVVAVDGATGRVRWHDALPVQPLAPVTDGRVLLAALSTEVLALDLGTGAVLWRAPLPAGHTLLTSALGLLLASPRDGSGMEVIG